MSAPPAQRKRSNFVRSVKSGYAPDSIQETVTGVFAASTAAAGGDVNCISAFTMLIKLQAIVETKEKSIVADCGS